jgi:transposase
MEPPPRFQPINRQQLLLRTVDIDRLIDSDHPARNIWDLLGQLDLSPFQGDIRSVEGHPGRAPWPPRLLIATWIYAYSGGLHSAREIERQCEYEPGLGWLTGLQTVNHHTLSDFRTTHGEALRELFVQVLGILKRQRLITLERVAQDGTKIRADASKKSFAKAGTIAESLAEARRHVAELEAAEEAQAQGREGAARRRRAKEREQRLATALREVERMQRERRWEKHKQCQASRTDPEARIMRDSNGGVAPAYNVQLVTDAAQGLIVGVDVTSRPTDEEELLPAMDRLVADVGALPEQVVVDRGYTTSATVAHMADRGIDLIGSWPDQSAQPPARGIDPAYMPAAFKHDPERDELICPAGKRLIHLRTKEEEWLQIRIYAASRSDCRDCSHRPRCTPQNKMPKRGRTVSIRIPDARVQAFKNKMQTEAARAIYRLRGRLAEFPNAWLKTKLGFTRFHSRGRKKATAEAIWAALTFNLQRLFKLLPDWRQKLATA